MTIKISIPKQDFWMLVPTIGFQWNGNPKTLEIVIAFLNRTIQIEIYE